MDALQLNRRRLLALTGSSMVLVSLSGCGGGEDAAAAPATAGPDPTPTPPPPAPPLPPPPPPTGASDFDGNGAAAAGSAGTPVSAAQRVAALDAVTAAMSSLASTAGGGPQRDAVALARQLQLMPAFHRVGISTRMGNVWARFTDGRSLVVVNNLQPPVPTGATAPMPAAGSSPTPPVTTRARALATRSVRLGGGIDLPALLVQNPYRQLDMMGRVPISSSVDAAHLCQDWVDADTLPALRRMAQGRGLTLPDIQRTLPPDSGHDNGVDGLRNISGDGVFFITACAAEVGSSDAPTSVICTATPHNLANEAAYAAELSNGALAYAVSWRGAETTWQPFACLAMTPHFPTLSNWRFPTECIAILNLSGGSVLAEWGSALSGAGLRNLFTWDKPVSWQRMLAFADDLIQIELGSNNFDGRNVRQDTPPRLRAYGVGATTGYLRHRGLSNDAGGSAQAEYLPENSPTGYVSVLVPTIDYASINENEPYIELVGQFGREQGLLQAPEVRVGGTPERPAEPLLARADGPMAGGDQAATLVWRGDLIQARLRPEHLARGGYVQVLNGDRWSNLLQITFWEIPIEVSATLTGGLTLQMTITLTVRADVRGYRLAPDGERWAGGALRILASSADSHARFTASGEIAQTEGRDTTTITWSGSGSASSTPGDMRVSGSGMLDWTARRWSPVVSVTGGGVHDQRRVVTRLDPDRGLIVVSDVTEQIPVSFFAPALPIPPLEWAFDERWNLLPGSYVNAVEPVTLLGPRTRTTTLNWAAVPARYSPVDDPFGGV